MAEGSKKRGLTPEQWIEARRRYEGGESEASIARAMTVHRTTLRERRKREVWSVQPNVQVDGPAVQRIVHERAQARVIDMASRRVIESAAADGTLELIATDLASALRRHAEIENLLLGVAASTLMRLPRYLGSGEMVMPERPLRSGSMSSEASEIKDAIAAAKAAIELSREIRGKRAGMASIAVPEDEEKAVAVEFVDTLHEESA